MPTFAAIIGHADDADMLQRCIAHHLAIGIDYVFVSLNIADAASDSVAREFATHANVRAAHVETFAPDPFHYFTAAKDVVMEWCAPDWVFFVDSDESWLPASGRIQDTAQLDSADMLAVQPFNVAPVRGSVSIGRGFDPSPETLVISHEHGYDTAQYLSDHPETPWIMLRYPTKVLVRPGIVESVGRGAHDITARGNVVCKDAHDLVILHVPVTTEARFLRKIHLIRTRMDTYGDRFGPGQAWHWRRWMEIDAAAGMHAEYERQLFNAADVPALLAQGVLETPSRVFARQLAPCD